MSPPSFWRQMFHILISPLAILELGYQVVTQPIQNNCLKKPIDSYKNREARISKDYNLKDILKQCKANKCTVNDACLSVLGQTVNEYAKRRNEDIQEIGFSRTYAMRTMPRRIEDIESGNDWVA